MLDDLLDVAGPQRMWIQDSKCSKIQDLKYCSESLPWSEDEGCGGSLKECLKFFYRAGQPGFSGNS